MEKDVDRVAFFSDAIFAIAITLLVLRISVPSASESLGEALAERGTSFLLFVISFWVIGRFWVSHHRMFRYVRGYDNWFINLDLFLMLGICFLPYPTELLGLHQMQPLAVAVYAGSVIVCSGTMWVLWWYARRKGFLSADIASADTGHTPSHSLPLMVVFGISVPLAYVDTTLAMYFWLASIPAQRLYELSAKRRNRAPGERLTGKSL